MLPFCMGCLKKNKWFSFFLSTLITCALQHTDRSRSTNAQNIYVLFFFTLCKVIQWARLEPLAGQFWPADRMFDTPDLDNQVNSRLSADLVDYDKVF